MGPYLSALPSANVDIVESVPQGPFVPLPADESNGGGGIPPQKLWGDGASDVALGGCLLERQLHLREAICVGRAFADVGTSSLVKDLGYDLEREFRDVHSRQVNGDGEVGSGWM